MTPERQAIQMSKTRFCNQCGAPIPRNVLFCERCGALVEAEDDGNEEVTRTMPRRVPSDRQGEARGVQGDVHPPIPVTQAPKRERTSDLRRKEDDRPDGKHDSEAIGWTCAVAFAIVAAVLIGYIVGVSNAPDKPSFHASGGDDTPQEWQYGIYGNEADDETGREAAKEQRPSETEEKGSPKSDGDSSDRKGAQVSDEGNTEGRSQNGDEANPTKSDDKARTDSKDESDEKGDERNEKAEKEGTPSESRNQEKKNQEERMTRLSDSIGSRMPLDQDGRIDLGLVVPDDGTNISERVEVIQDGRVIYGSRIVRPGEALSWVPADEAHAGKATAVVYGIVGDDDYGEPVIVEVEIVDA